MRMRRVVDIAIVAAVVSACAGGWLWMRAGAEEDAVIEATRQAVAQLQREVRSRAGTGQAELNERGWPLEVDPKWFEGQAPRNELISPDRPWLEIAPLEQMDLEHPPDRIAIDRRAAAFWYNPARGVVRARVSPGVSDRRTTEIYNEVNSTALASIFEAVGLKTALATALAGLEDAPEEGQATAAAPEDGEGSLDPTAPRPK